MAKTGKILVTGADGFLGTHVSDVLSKLKINHTPSIKSDLDILNKNEIISKTKGFNAIIHLAGNVRTPATDSAENHFNINSIGTLNVLEACRINKVPRIIMASSTEVYGDYSKSVKIAESDSPIPINFYGQSKLLAEHFCREYFIKFGINFTLLRLTYLYGQGMHPSRIVPKIINAAISNQKLDLAADPKAFMDILYVKDAASALALALLSNRSWNKILNISSGKKTRISDLIKTVKHFYPNSRITLSTKKEANNFHIYNNSRARKILNFKPEYDLKAGFKDYINCLKNSK